MASSKNFSVERPLVVARKRGSKRPGTAVPPPSAPMPPVPVQPQPAAAEPPPAQALTAPSRPPAAAPPPVSAPPSAPRPDPDPSAQAEWRQRRSREAKALLPVIMERWPHAYPRDHRAIKPLIPGLHRTIAEQVPGQTPAVIRHALGLWHRQYGVAYLRALIRGGPRYDLAGQPYGVVTPEEQQRARQLLAEFYARRQAKRAAAHRPAGAQAHWEGASPDAE